MYEKAAAQEDPDFCHVYDAPIHYVVLKNHPNVFTFDKVSKLIDLYDKVDKTTGPGVIVTVSTSPKIFSAGFDLSYWMEDLKVNPIISGANIQGLFSKIMTLSMPSLCVINGHAYGAGFVIALCHRFRAMKASSAKVCLSEINLGFPLNKPFNSICKDKIPIKAFRELVYGISWTAEQAKQGGFVEHVYKTDAESEAIIKAFAKKFVVIGHQRMAIKLTQ